MSSIRQQLVDAITARLELIAPDTIFNLPSGQTHVCSSSPKSVTFWRKADYSLAQVPALRLFDRISNPGDGLCGSSEHHLLVNCQPMVAGASAAADARNLMADVRAAVWSDPTWGGLADWTDIQTEELDVDQGADVVAGAQLDLVIVYTTAQGRM